MITGPGLMAHAGSVQTANVTARRRKGVRFLAVVLGLAAVLLVLPIKEVTHPTHADRTTGLAVSWMAGADRVEIIAVGFRGRSAVEVRVGSRSRTQLRADAAGTVRLELPFDAATTGRSGISVTVTGRAPSGAARALAGAVPPRVAGNGPVDLLPWSLGAVLVAGAAAMLLRGYRHRLRGLSRLRGLNRLSRLRGLRGLPGLRRLRRPATAETAIKPDEPGE